MKIEGQIKLARTIVEQKEFIQWDGTDKHYYEIESYLRKRGLHIFKYTSVSGKELIEYPCAPNQTSLCDKYDFLIIPSLNVAKKYAYLSSITKNEFEQIYSDWQKIE